MTGSSLSMWTCSHADFHEACCIVTRCASTGNSGATLPCYHSSRFTVLFSLVHSRLSCYNWASLTHRVTPTLALAARGGICHAKLRVQRRTTYAARSGPPVRGEGNQAAGRALRHQRRVPLAYHQEGQPAWPDEPQHPRRIWRPRRGRAGRVHRQRGAGLGLLRHPDGHDAQQPGLLADHPGRQRRPEAQVPGRVGDGQRQDVGLRPDRAQRRVGRGRHQDHRRQAGRPLHPQRQQDLDHQRAHRRFLRHLRQDRSWPRATAACRSSWSSAAGKA